MRFRSRSAETLEQAQLGIIRGLLKSAHRALSLHRPPLLGGHRNIHLHVGIVLARLKASADHLNLRRGVHDLLLPGNLLLVILNAEIIADLFLHFVLRAVARRLKAPPLDIAALGIDFFLGLTADPGLTGHRLVGLNDLIGLAQYLGILHLGALHDLLIEFLVTHALLKLCLRRRVSAVLIADIVDHLLPAAHDFLLKLAFGGRSQPGQILQFLGQIKVLVGLDHGNVDLLGIGLEVSHMIILGDEHGHRGLLDRNVVDLQQPQTDASGKAEFLDRNDINDLNLKTAVPGSALDQRDEIAVQLFSGRLTGSLDRLTGDFKTPQVRLLGQLYRQKLKCAVIDTHHRFILHVT